MCSVDDRDQVKPNPGFGADNVDPGLQGSKFACVVVRGEVWLRICFGLDSQGVINGERVSRVWPSNRGEICNG